MSAARHRATLLALLALSPFACKYDLEKLRPSDAAALVDTPAPPMDVPDVPAVPDAPAPTDVPRDVPVARDVPTRPPRVGTCNTHPFVELMPQSSNNFGGTLVVNGNTMIDTPMSSAFMQPVFGAGCSMAGTMAAPERVFKYTVQRGPRLVATTNGAPCSGAFDTVLYAINSCDMPVNGANVIDCNDDDVAMCGMCPTGVTCGTVLSTVEIGPVQAGDVVYLVVDGYLGMGGPFRLSVAENGARPVSPPETALMSHCSCPSLTGGFSALVDGFPNGMIDPGGGAFAMPNDMVSGLRSVNLRTITGVSGQFRMGANNIAPMGSCASARAIVDVLVQNTVVASFQLTGVQEPGATVQVMYSTFAPVTVTDATRVPLAYRLRGFDPPSCMGSFEIDRSAAMGVNQLTLYGTR